MTDESRFLFLASTWLSRDWKSFTKPCDSMTSHVWATRFITGGKRSVGKELVSCKSWGMEEAPNMRVSTRLGIDWLMGGIDRVDAGGNEGSF